MLARKAFHGSMFEPLFSKAISRPAAISREQSPSFTRRSQLIYIGRAFWPEILLIQQNDGIKTRTAISRIHIHIDATSYNLI